jgi:hypothetical protein
LSFRTRSREALPMSDPPASSASSRAREKAADFEWLHGGRDADGGGKPARREMRRPAAMLCDAGELDDLYATLSRLSHRPLRVRPEDIDDLRPWEHPTRLFVTSVRVALDHPLDLIRAEPELVSIAVADGDAHTVATAMLRRGFRYVVRRPAHPEAVRLLLMQVLYRGPEHRLATRFPFGDEVSWRSGLRRGRCVMSEISAQGGRLLTREPLARGARIRIKLPAALPGARALRLKGRVLRRDFSSEGEAERTTHLVVQFGGLSSRTQAHLDALLAERASGPATARTQTQLPVAPRRSESRGPSRFLTLTQDEPAPESEAAPTYAGPEQRGSPRAVWQSEVVTLDAVGDRVQLTLMGTDLSEHGMRVEPHPLLKAGERLRLALYDRKSAQPLVIEAWVARDDGARGCGLAFERVDAATRARLRGMVAEAAPISSLGPGAKRPQGLVVGEIVNLRAGR